MKAIFPAIIIGIAFLASDLFSQQDTTLKKGWNPKGILGLGLSQVALSNWVKGGENVISVTIKSDFAEHYFNYPWLLKNTFVVNLGSTKTGGGGFQTNENGLILENVLIRKIGWAIDPYISNLVRTVIVKGYDYKANPIQQTSAFFDPGYVSQSLGLTFDRPHFSTRLGLAFQETFTNKFRQYTDDINTAGKKEAYKFQTGIESVTEANYTVAENMLYTSRLRLFSAFETIDVWDVGWENSIIAKVNSFLNVSLNAILLYEKAQSPKTQFKEGLTLGITYAVF